MSLEIITHRMEIELSQDGNTDGTTGDSESLTIEIEGMWMDESGRGFAVLRTEGWSINDSAEMAQVIDAVQDAAEALTQKMRSFAVKGVNDESDI